MQLAHRIYGDIFKRTFLKLREENMGSNLTHKNETKMFLLDHASKLNSKPWQLFMVVIVSHNLNTYQHTI